MLSIISLKFFYVCSEKDPISVLDSVLSSKSPVLLEICRMKFYYCDRMLGITLDFS